MKYESKCVADRKQKKWKNQVCRCATVPTRVLERSKHGGPGAWIINQNHKSDGGSTKYIECREPLFACFFLRLAHFSNCKKVTLDFESGLGWLRAEG
jgi:hypothetical protein